MKFLRSFFLLVTIAVSLAMRAETNDLKFIPATPVILGWSNFNPSLGYGVIRYIVPLKSVAGTSLPASDISYRMLVNGEPYLYHAVNNPFPDGEMTAEWIPVTYEDYDVKIENGSHYLFFFFDGSNNLAIESRYVDPLTGTEWLSSGVNNGEIRVSEISEDNDVVSRTYFNVSGERIESPLKGLVIEQDFHTDGSVSSRKVIIRN